MSHTDAVADLLTRIRNASQAGLPHTAMPYASIRERVARLLFEEGYLSGVEVIEAEGRKQLVVSIKYVGDRRRVITTLERVSKPGRRIYMGYQDIKPVRNGLGVTILSTPKGLLSDTAARKLKVGGEVVCRVW